MTDRRNGPCLSPERNTRGDTGRCNAYVKQLRECVCRFHRVSHSSVHKQGYTVIEARRLRAKMPLQILYLRGKQCPPAGLLCKLIEVRIAYFLVARITNIDAVGTNGVQNDVVLLGLNSRWNK